MNTMRMLVSHKNSFTNSYRKFSSLFGQGSMDISDGFLEQRTKVTGYGDQAFGINDVIVRNSVILLPKQYFIWNVYQFSDINIASLQVFALLVPTVEVLLIGCGEKLPKRLPLEITNYFKSKGIYVEATNTASATATFNILNSEDRNVAAALLTMKPVVNDAFKMEHYFPTK
jgi:uncharacterized protein